MNFLFSSFTGIPDSYFEGYCFFEKDYIFGNEGLNKFRDATGISIPPGQDGCYLLIQKTGDTHRVSVDYSGLKKIFYYNKDGVWCFSNSLVDIANHLSEKKIRLTINYPQLVSLKIQSVITLQTSCFSTIFNEINLLPSFCHLVVKKNSLFAVKNNLPQKKDYTTSLKLFLETWVGRLETLMNDEQINLSSDLSGGQDSRAIFALLQKARERSANDGSRLRIISSTTKYCENDYVVAKKIADSYNITLNSDENKLIPSRMTAKESYYYWKTLCLGSYLPIYFPYKWPSPFDVHLHGAGGENHRPFYPLCTTENFIDKKIKSVTPSFLFQDWRSELIHTAEILLGGRNDVHPLINHYREFRNRMHGGRPERVNHI